jgi:AAA+ ATPase superfamily predicted ATPase
MEKLKFGINYPMTLLLGMRRSGKSSIVKVLMNKEKRK